MVPEGYNVLRDRHALFHSFAYTYENNIHLFVDIRDARCLNTIGPTPFNNKFICIHFAVMYI